MPLNTQSQSRVSVAEAFSPPLFELIHHLRNGPLPQSAALEKTLAALVDLSQRVTHERFNLAVVGQFKRGKSTLINALLGTALLPSAVTPLTAIPTYILSGRQFRLRTERENGRSEDLSATTAEAMRQLLEARVTERSNPKNAWGYTRIEVEVPSELLRHGIVLIDTPGIGSTYRHNTLAAEEILPACDAALFVVSVDPPITELEIAHLKLVQRHAARIVVVLNKVDLQSADDQEASVSFLAKTLQEAGFPDLRIFAVSAREALTAKNERNAQRLDVSGFGTLEAFLYDFAREDKKAVLKSSVVRKTISIIQEALFAIDSALAALRMPIEKLSICMTQFDEASHALLSEYQRCEDGLTADERRLLAALDAEAASLRTSARATLMDEINQRIAQNESEKALSAHIQMRLPDLFAVAADKLAADYTGRLRAVFTAHQDRANRLILHIRTTAADILGIPNPPPPVIEFDAVDDRPSWVTTPRETLSLIPPALIDWFLLPAMRRARMSKRMNAVIEDCVSRNTESLRWDVHQHIREQFRKFRTELGKEVATAVEAAKTALVSAAELSATNAEGIASEVACLNTLRAVFVAALPKSEDVASPIDAARVMS
jgi:small GTP-binding protein